MTSIAIIPAGGKGFRSGYSTPKQYLKVHGKEIIVYTLQIFQKNKFIDEIIIAAEPEYFYHLIKLINKYKLSKVKLIVEGGSTRQQYFIRCNTIGKTKRKCSCLHKSKRHIN